MKKAVCLIILIVIIISLCGCSDSPKEEPKSSQTESIEVVEDMTIKENANSETTIYVASETNRGVGVVCLDDVVYVSDRSGIWKKTKDSSNKEYISKNPASFIATDGSTILYVYKKSEAEVGDFYVRNAEIHSVNIDGSNDTAIIECNDSAQPFLIYDNQLYYADFAVPESFHRELFSVSQKDF